MGVLKSLSVVTWMIVLACYASNVKVRSVGEHDSKQQGYNSALRLGSSQKSVPVGKKETFCFEDKCTCMPLQNTSIFFNCSHNFGTLTFIPIP